ncbi:phosphoenolpyruvate--protein phosphotransferase [Novosphingobium sp. 9U]|uniref:phosphoenolpyruvate--protein phosphotransferase n=1 Tax=Novosphingobium sp. 9U TaxID=2653158 RepID=UPI0012F437A0|nr:phosphoenolpyruvate--protein phosphotransferase [Novosphingobium sp. 9U]VWX46711.1 Phosphoenolpyruvate-protein phosphotransferase / Phosphocarrier protein HPr / PTS system fructose-specific EIIA component [Novosphingobium sp. 9U]
MTAVALHAPFAGWLAPLSSVPDPVFGEGMMGPGAAIDPTEAVLRAPAAAQVLSIPDSAHAVTLLLANGVELLMHIGLETVALGGRGFEAQVRAGDRVAVGDPLIRFDLDAVALAAKDLITPIVVVSEGARIVVERPGRLLAAGDRFASVEAGAAAAPQTRTGSIARRTIQISAPHGIHARPAARIVALLRPYVAEVTLRNGDAFANARSTTSLLALAAKHGQRIEAEASGADAEAALDALAAFAAERFGDEEGAEAPMKPSTQGGGGICASPGLAIGQAFHYRARTVAPPRDGAGVALEREALDAALRQTAAMQAGAIGEAHRALIEDPDLLATAQREIAEGRSAAHAWLVATEQAAAVLRATGDSLLMERAADLEDVGQQVVQALTGVEAAPPALPKSAILIAQDLLPSQFLALDQARLAGIVTAAGGPTAHVAILASSAGIPMIVAAGEGVLAIPEGQSIILDADAARIESEPAVDRLASVAQTIAERRERRAADASSAHELCHMADGTRIEVFANLGSLADAAAAVSTGAEGCGLLRTEFLFLDREHAPDEDEQRALYASIAATLGDRPLILRTLDIGGDKPVPYLPAAHEENPALGLRGVRLSLARPDLLETQLCAAVAGVPGEQCRIMVPMITDLAELRAVRAMLDRAIAAVGRSKPVALGVMIETPSAALLADQIAAEADFLSIGTNDLTQYALACDRGNAAVSAKVDALHPAVLRLIGMAAQGARSHGRWIGVCGGLAADTLAAPVLIGLGVTELSAPPAAIPAIKAAVRRLDMAACVALAERACAASCAQEVRTILKGAVQ